MGKVNSKFEELYHDWSFLPNPDKALCLVCKRCGGMLGTEIVGGKVRRFPYPGDECPISVVSLIHEL